MVWFPTIVERSLKYNSSAVNLPVRWHAHAMGAMPETHYACDGGSHFAYQVLGDHGPDLLFAGPDLLFALNPNFPIDLVWDEPTVAVYLHRLGSFSRLILTDVLGVGSSDSTPTDNPSIQVWTDGLVAVLDAVGSERASVFGMTDSALSLMVLAATHPQRVRSVVLASPSWRLTTSAVPTSQRQSRLMRRRSRLQATISRRGWHRRCLPAAEPD